MMRYRQECTGFQIWQWHCPVAVMRQMGREVVYEANIVIVMEDATFGICVVVSRAFLHTFLSAAPMTGFATAITRGPCRLGFTGRALQLFLGLTPVGAGGGSGHGCAAMNEASRAFAAFLCLDVPQYLLE